MRRTFPRETLTLTVDTPAPAWSNAFPAPPSIPHLARALLLSLLLPEASPDCCRPNLFFRLRASMSLLSRLHLLIHSGSLFQRVLVSFFTSLAISSTSRVLTQILSFYPQQLQVQEPVMAVENQAPPCRKKSQEKKSSFRKAFSHKKHSSKEPKRAGAADAASPESRPPKRPSYLPLCVGGHRSSISSSLGE